MGGGGGTMKGLRLLLLASLLASGSVLLCSPARAATPTFTISATNVTMPSSGDGAIPYTLTSVDGYTGSITVGCSGVNAPADARIPACGGGPVVVLNLTANGTISQSLPLTPYGVPLPLTPAATAAAALLLGFGLRRRFKVRWAALALIALGTLVSLAGVTGCGSSPGMTPGTYAYTVTATDLKTNTAVSTTANVTVR